MFDGFISSFCKVEFLCYAGDPNWLGWMVLVMGGLGLHWFCWKVALAAHLTWRDFTDVS